MDLKQYREHVKKLAAQRVGEPVYNGSADHATVIVENMFAAARNHIRVLTGDLDAKVYGTLRVVERARQFVAHDGHRLEILVESASFNSTHPLIEAVANESNVSIREIPADLSARIGFHFMTADDDCFRFEREKNTHAAVAAFGDVETARHLNEIFQHVKTVSTELDKHKLLN